MREPLLGKAPPEPSRAIKKAEMALEAAVARRDARLTQVMDAEKAIRSSPRPCSASDDRMLSKMRHKLVQAVFAAMDATEHLEAVRRGAASLSRGAG